MKNHVCTSDKKYAMRRWIVRALAVAAVLCGPATSIQGQARATQFNTASNHANSVTVGYQNDDCTVITSAYTAAGGGNTLTFSAGPSSPFQVIRQSEQADCSITADFPNGTKALAVNTITQGARAPLTIAFSVPVTQIEFQAQIFGFGTERFTFEVFNGEESLGAFTVEDQMDYTQTGTRGYIGARASNDEVITKIRIWADFVDDSKHNEAVANKFAIGPVSFRTDRDQ
ncbi:MAG: hypothetical protein ACKVX9_11885 [Blastocatellia bacterium]